ncbi:MAG: hypothetical protein C4524_10110 [Candidatus Zixiibacteriota bacterium]|nr:MAG: hypothetical protein C4524_10110 [candidate division Zixibacteria bacterium]
MVLLTLPYRLGIPGRILPVVAVVTLALLLYRGGPPADAQTQDRNLHQVHVTEQNMSCQDCHEPNLQINREFCVNCHAATEVDGLVEAFRENTAGLNRPPLPPDHTIDFRRQHGQDASLQPEWCTRCHAQRFCLDCHEGENLQGRIHPLNFRFTHPFSVLDQESECLTCHETREFCVDCHRQQRVLTHPLGAGWANVTTGGAHAGEAEANLESCLSCHDLGLDDPTCIRPGCHGHGGDE